MLHSRVAQRRHCDRYFGSGLTAFFGSGLSAFQSRRWRSRCGVTALLCSIALLHGMYPSRPITGQVMPRRPRNVSAAASMAFELTRVDWVTRHEMFDHLMRHSAIGLVVRGASYMHDSSAHARFISTNAQECGQVRLTAMSFSTQRLCRFWRILLWRCFQRCRSAPSGFAAFGTARRHLDLAAVTAELMPPDLLLGGTLTGSEAPPVIALPDRQRRSAERQSDRLHHPLTVIQPMVLADHFVIQQGGRC